MSDRPAGLSAVLYALDVDRVSAFYSAVLALPAERPDPAFAVLGAAGWQFVVHAIPAPYADGIDITDPPAVRDETPLKVVLPVDDLARARSTAPAHGGRVHPPNREWTFAGTVRCDGVDPEGNVFQLAQPG